MSIKTKNLETEQQRLKISREGEYARQEQEQEVAVCRAEQEAGIAEEEAQKKREAEEAKIAAGRAVDLKCIAAECDIKNEDIKKTSRRTGRSRTLHSHRTGRARLPIAVAEKSRAEFAGKAEADKARAAVR